MKKSSLSISMSAFLGASVMVVGCSAKSPLSSTAPNGLENQLVECYGVGKTDSPVVMPKKMCDQLPATKQMPAPANATIPVVDQKDYIQCYGVAAAGKNDCATADVSCGGKVMTARAPDAWISLPKGICDSLMGSSTTPPPEKK